jgi:ERCC4-related helicase
MLGGGVLPVARSSCRGSHCRQVIVCIDTGSGKTRIAAEVIARKLPALSTAHRKAVFLAPTNPLVAQQFQVRGVAASPRASP